MNTRRYLLTAAVATACALPVSAQKAVPDLTSASLEELMNIEVYSVAKKPQRMGATAASVYVINAEDIRRSGMRTVPELLRLAPGVQVARTQSGGWAISIRGFADEFSNKLLVLVDGRSVYDELFGGIFWGLQDMLVDDIERIEVIRGPGAAMWGINAVNGVINIITKQAEDTQGQLVKFAAGSETEVNGAVRSGGQIGSKAAYRVTAYYTGHGPYEAPESVVPDSRYGWNARRLDFRLDWSPTLRDSVDVTGAGYVSQSGRTFAFPSPSNLLPVPQEESDNGHYGTMQARWKHTYSDRSNTVLRAAWTDTDNNMGVAGARTVIGEFEFQHNLNLGRTQLTWGLNYRDVSRHVTTIESFGVHPASSSQDTYAGFFANQFELVRDKLYFIAGLHASNNQFTGLEVQPTGRLLWTPSKKWTGWAAVSRAVRTPTLFERSSSGYVQSFAAGPLTGLVDLQPNPNFKSEPMISYEAGQRFDVGKRFSLDVSGFMSFYQDLGTLNQGPLEFVPATAASYPYVQQDVFFGNSRYGQSRGVEAAVTFAPTKRWKLAGGYSWLRVTSGAYAGYPATLSPAYRQNNSPQNQFQIRSYYDLTKTIQFDTALYYSGYLPDGDAPGGFTPAYLRGDVRLGWRPASGLEMSVGVQNAFDPSHPEMNSTFLQRRMDVPRNVYGSITWHF